MIFVFIKYSIKCTFTSIYTPGPKFKTTLKEVGKWNKIVVETKGVINCLNIHICISMLHTCK